MNLETGKEEIHLVQGALRPSILGAYEYVFPEDCLPEVLSIFGITKNESYGFKKIGLKARHFGLRKLFGAKKIPKKYLEEAKKINPEVFISNSHRGLGHCIIPGVAIHVIGIKKDRIGEHVSGYYQELL